MDGSQARTDHMIAFSMNGKGFQIEPLHLFREFRVPAVERTGRVEKLLCLIINM